MKISHPVPVWPPHFFLFNAVPFLQRKMKQAKQITIQEKKLYQEETINGLCHRKPSFCSSNQSGSLQKAYHEVRELKPPQCGKG